MFRVVPGCPASLSIGVGHSTIVTGSSPLVCMYAKGASRCEGPANSAGVLGAIWRQFNPEMMTEIRADEHLQTRTVDLHIRLCRQRSVALLSLSVLKANGPRKPPPGREGLVSTPGRGSGWNGGPGADLGSGTGPTGSWGSGRPLPGQRCCPVSLSQARNPLPEGGSAPSRDQTAAGAGADPGTPWARDQPGGSVGEARPGDRSGEERALPHA